VTLHRVVESEGFTWLDVVSPSRLDLQDLARTYDLHQTVVEDCLDPEHLPKHEKIGDATFLILRAHDDSAKDDASSIQELTRKVAIFFRPNFALTVHRVDLHEVAMLRERFGGRGGAPAESCTLPLLLFGLGNNILGSYEKPLELAEQLVDQIEAGLFDGGPPPSLEQAHNLKRRVSLIRRILWQSSQVINKLVPQAERAEPLYQDVRESVEALLFWADQLLDEANNLQQVHLAVASHRNNEVMRVLTVFSAFFLPLTFIVGIYGMNFAHMPELAQPWGYPAVLVIMVGVSAAIASWFRRKGWLGG
jgi:magnesium transporter